VNCIAFDNDSLVTNLSGLLCLLGSPDGLLSLGLPDLGLLVPLGQNILEKVTFNLNTGANMYITGLISSARNPPLECINLPFYAMEWLV